MELTGKQTRYLRGLAHHLKPVVLVGSAGLSDPVVAKIDEELENHELIKVKFGQGSDLNARDGAGPLAERVGAQVAQVIGRTALLYRRRKKDPEIKLPKE